MRFLTVSVASALLLFFTAARSAVTLPDLGDESSVVLSPTQERKLGEDFMRKARRALPYLDDPELADYIQTLGSKLVAHSDSGGMAFHFYVVADPTINAFAVPGGFVSVHTGLILAAQNESELASVLAHEIAHITQRHIPRMIAEQQRTSLPALAAILAAILLASAGHDGGDAAVALTTAGLAQRGLNFTRQFEQEADRIGMKVLAGAGFEPHAMPTFFERMQALNRHNDTNLPGFLRTHPVTTDRIAESRDRAQAIEFKARPDGTAFHHARAKVRAISAGSPADAVTSFKVNLEQGKFADKRAERYGYALAQLRARELEGAKRTTDGLVAEYPKEPMYRIAQAEVLFAQGKSAAALDILRATHKQHPGYTPLLRRYAEMLVKADQTGEASKVLEVAIKRRSDDPALYKLLAQAAGNRGDRLEAHQALAQHYYLNGDPRAAIDQLQIALRFAGDNFYKQSSLEARIREIKEELGLQQESKK